MSTAPDLDAIEARSRARGPRDVLLFEDLPALIAEARTNRARLAAVEAVRRPSEHKDTGRRRRAPSRAQCGRDRRSAAS